MGITLVMLSSSLYKNGYNAETPGKLTPAWVKLLFQKQPDSKVVTLFGISKLVNFFSLHFQC